MHPNPIFSLCSRFHQSIFEMPYYRQVLLIRKNASPNELSKVMKSCAELVLKKEGVYHGVDHRGLKELGYPIVDKRRGVIDRHREARLMISKFTLSTSGLKDLEKDLKLNESVVRFETFKSRDPLRDFLTQRRNPDELLDEHFQLQDVPQSTVAKIKRVGVQQLKELEDDDEYANIPVGRVDELEKELPTQYGQSLSSEERDNVEHWRRDMSYEVPLPEENK